jgi:hypothetical protein
MKKQKQKKYSFPFFVFVPILLIFQITVVRGNPTYLSGWENTNMSINDTLVKTIFSL